MGRAFTQHPGVDFLATFSPVVDFGVLRNVLLKPALKGWSLWALDVKQVHLNATLSEDVWLELPDGSVVKAANVTYGLKQSAMKCYNKLRRTVLDEKWTSNGNGEYLYYRRGDIGRTAVLTTFLDDIIIFGDYTEVIEKTIKASLAKYEG